MNKILFAIMLMTTPAMADGVTVTVTGTGGTVTVHSHSRSTEPAPPARGGGGTSTYSGGSTQPGMVTVDTSSRGTFQTDPTFNDRVRQRLFESRRQWRRLPPPPSTYGYQETLPPADHYNGGTASGGYGGFYGGNVNLLGVQ